MRILVRRSGALGDVVLATPIVRRLRRENPQAEIVVQTGYPDVFRNNPRCTTSQDPQAQYGPYDRVVELDLAYECRPSMHVVEAYMTVAVGDLGDPADRRQELFFPRTPRMFPYRRYPYVAVHAAQAGWRNRTLPQATWVEVVRLLRAAGAWPIMVGTQRDALPQAKATSFHSHDLAAQARLIASCDCFVGSDSGLLHVAGATDVPIVGVFTCARPEYRLPWRGGILGRDCLAVVPDLGCVGCLERQPTPATMEACERGDVACVSMVDPAAVVVAVMGLVGR